MAAPCDEVETIVPAVVQQIPATTSAIQTPYNYTERPSPYSASRGERRGAANPGHVERPRLTCGKRQSLFAEFLPCWLKREFADCFEIGVGAVQDGDLA